MALQPQKTLDNLTANSRENKESTQNSHASYKSSKRGLADESSGAGITLRSGKHYAPAKIYRSPGNHLSDVVSEVLEQASNSNVTVIDTKKFDCDYDTIYAAEIINYMRELEDRKRLPQDYLANRNGPLSRKNRSIVIDWLIQVQHYLKLKQETLYLAIYLFDVFFFNVKEISADNIQLVAISCVLISSKVEERYIPELGILLHLTDNAYTANYLRRMERVVLKTLGFELVMADPMVFLERCIQATNGACKQLVNLSTFLIDILLPNVKVVRELLPSKMAASAFCLARRLLITNERAWNKTLAYYSGYEEEDLKETMVWMLCAVSDSADTKCELQGARLKYSSKSTYENLSSLPLLSTDSIAKIMKRFTF